MSKAQANGRSANGDCRPASCSPDRVPNEDRKIIFHVCQKLNAVLGLNDQELSWLASLGAEIEHKKP